MHARAIPPEALEALPEPGRALIRAVLLARWGTAAMSELSEPDRALVPGLVAARLLVIWPGLDPPPPPATEDKQALARRRRDLPYGPRVTLSPWAASAISHELAEERLEGPLRWFGPGERRPAPLLRKLAGFVSLPFPDRLVAPPPEPEPEMNPLIARLGRLARLASSLGPLRARSRSNKPTRMRQSRRSRQAALS